MSLFTVGDGLMILALFAWLAGFLLVAAVLFVTGLGLWYWGKL